MVELSLVVSALNEEKNIKTLFTKLTQIFDRDNIDGEIVFLNNHSTDKTGELAEAYAKKDKRIHVIQRYNRESDDLGSSLREGFEHCKGRYILIMDADLSHDPETIKDLLAHKNDADIIVGSRFTKGGKGEMNFSRNIISRLFNFFAGIPILWKVKDTTTGFKLYKKEAITSLKLTNNGFGLHVEILLKAINKGFSVKEIPIHYHARTGGKSKLVYQKQFLTYTKPVLMCLKEKVFGP